MPGRAQYDQSFESPSQLLRVPDPDLLGGRVQRMPYKTEAGTTTVPWAVEGAGAVVYRYRTQSNRLRALRLYTRPFDEGIHERYDLLSPYLDEHAADLTVRLQYHDPGIVVTLDNGRHEQLPMLEMDWVEGSTLLEKVDDLCRARDQAGLALLVDEWVFAFQSLQASNIAHGDLSATNIMVRPDGRLAIVDYDETYAPPLAGREVRAAGSEGYQHPGYERPFDERMDRFSALVIYAALEALSCAPTLWPEDVRVRQSGKPIADGMLFSSADFADPSESSLFQKLGGTTDGRLAEAVQALKAACAAPDDVKLPAGLVDPEYAERATLARLVSDLRRAEDEQVAQMWVPTAQDRSPAQDELPPFQIVEEPAPMPKPDGTQTEAPTDPGAEGAPKERDGLEMAHEKPTPHERPGGALSDELEGLRQETRRLAAVEVFRDGLKTDDDGQIVAAYAPILDDAAEVTEDERRRLSLARQRIALRKKVMELVGRGDVEEAIRAEHDAGFYVCDERLGAAKQAFVDECPATDLRTVLHEDGLWARWEWPATPAVRVAVVAWRTDRFPESPDEAGAERDFVERSVYDRQGGFWCRHGQAAKPGAGWRRGFSQGKADLLRAYVRVFTATRSAGASGEPTSWIYSSPTDGMAQGVARPKCRVQWELARPRGASHNQLRLQTRDGSPLPHLIVVRKTGGMPITVAEGTVVARLSADELSSPASVVVDLDVGSWPPGTVLRVFPARPEDATWVVAEGKRGEGVKIQVS